LISKLRLPLLSSSMSSSERPRLQFTQSWRKRNFWSPRKSLRFSLLLGTMMSEWTKKKISRIKEREGLRRGREVPLLRVHPP